MVSDRTRHEYVMQFSSVRVQEGSITPFLHYTTDGRGQIYLHDSAFWGASSWADDVSRFALTDVLSHAFIHQAGIISVPGRLDVFGLRHDLAGFRRHGMTHDKILEACR